MEYRIVAEEQFHLVAERVNALIAEGWTPLGGVSVSFNRDGSAVVCQAMTRTA